MMFSPRMRYKRYRHGHIMGFTMIELLVVIMIIGLLASIILVQLSTVRVRERDAEREQEIRSLQNALALYGSTHQLYPAQDPASPLTGTDSVSIELMNAEALSAIPVDPLDNGNYRYRYWSDGVTYIITYYLEGDSIPQKPAGIHVAGP